MANGDVLFQAFPLADWPWGGDTGNLYIFDTEQYIDQNGVFHLSNVGQSLVDPLQQCPILINGRTAVVQDFYYQPTTLSIDRPNTRRTGVIADQYDDIKYDLFTGALFPELPNPMTSTEFARANWRARCRPRMQDRYLDRDAIEDRIASIETISAQDLARLDSARGTAQLAVDEAAGFSQVVVPCVLITADSLITPWSMDDNVSGALRAPARTIGQDFTIRSNVVGDAGLVGWRVSEPF